MGHSPTVVSLYSVSLKQFFRYFTMPCGLVWCLLMTTVSILGHNRSLNQSCLMHTSVCPVIDVLMWEHLITVTAAVFLVCEVNLLDFSVLWGDIFRSFPSKFYPLVPAHIYVGWIIIWWLSNDYFLIPSSLFISWHSTMRKYLVCLFVSALTGRLWATAAMLKPPSHLPVPDTVTAWTFLCPTLDPVIEEHQFALV